MSTVVEKRPRHVVLNLLAGLFLGLGVSIMLLIYGIVDWTSMWPNVVIAIGLALGVVMSALPRRKARPAPAAAAPATEPAAPTGQGDGAS